jgi:16S rRNA (uracil1498-N3)-methyltransferase
MDGVPPPRARRRARAMSRRRLFVPAARLGGARLTLSGDEHRHVARVLRARPGDTLTLFDGAGTEVDAEILRVDAREVELALSARRVTKPAAVVAITLLVAVPRGERMDLLVQKTTELGVGRIVPVVTGRSVARPEAGSARQPRWEKIAREAARQCGRADVPHVDEPTALATALAAPELPPRRFALWEGEESRSLPRALAAGGFAPAAPGAGIPSVALLVGPEGGFAEDEIARASAAGFVPVGLGPRILRVETAAIVAVALVQAALGGLD